jgi:starch phosphorylase
VEDLRYQHVYHPVPLEQKSPALARVIDTIASGFFGDGAAYQPYVLGCSVPLNPLIDHNRLLGTILQHDYYLITDDFESCKAPVFKYISISFFADIEALKMVDEAYLDREEWIKKSIKTVAKVSFGCLANCASR